MLKFKFAMTVNMISELPWLQAWDKLLIIKKSKLVYVPILLKDVLTFEKYTLYIQYVLLTFTCLFVQMYKIMYKYVIEFASWL